MLLFIVRICERHLAFNQIGGSAKCPTGSLSLHTQFPQAGESTLRVLDETWGASADGNRPGATGLQPAHSMQIDLFFPSTTTKTPNQRKPQRSATDLVATDLTPNISG